MTRPRALTVSLFLLLALLHVEQASAAEEPTLRVETKPQWTSGELALYLFGFPGDGAEYSQDSILVRVAVWGATEENPITIQLDGEEAALIDHEGLFTYEWSIQGSHQLLIRCKYMIFQQATFNVKAPPPPEPVVLLIEFNRRLEQQFTVMLMWAVAASGAGAWMGLETLKRTKIQTQWVLPIPGLAMGVGARYLPDLYMLIPWGIALSVVYWYAKPYARELTLLSLEDHQVDATRRLVVDDDGKAIIGVGPKYWRYGFIKRKNIRVVDEYQVTLRHKGLHQGVCLKKLEESDTEVTVECNKSLAKIIVEGDALDTSMKLTNELWRENTKLESLAELKKEQEIRYQVKERVHAVLVGRKGEDLAKKE